MFILYIFCKLFNLSIKDSEIEIEYFKLNIFSIFPKFINSSLKGINDFSIKILLLLSLHIIDLLSFLFSLQKSKLLLNFLNNPDIYPS